MIGASVDIARPCHCSGRKPELHRVKLVALSRTVLWSTCVHGEFHAMIDPSELALRLALISPGAS